MNQTNHQALFYESDQERLSFLARYFSIGLMQNEMCVWVTDCPQSSAAKLLEEAGLEDAARYIAEHKLCVFNAQQSYLHNDQFTSQYMLANVYSFLEDAQNDGFAGLRTAGEMNWLHDHPEARDEASAYEAVINTISGAIPFTGLCLYATERTSLDVMRSVLDTHPVIARNNTTVPNPLFQSPV